MNIQKIKRYCKQGYVALSLLPLQALASTTGSNLPWESTLDKIKTSIQGPVLLSISTVMLVVTLLMMAFGEWGDVFKRFLQISMILSACFAVPSMITILFGAGAVF